MRLLGLRPNTFVTVLAGTMAASGAAGVFLARDQRAQAKSELARPVELLRVMPLYPRTRFYSMGSDLHVDGVRRLMAYALTPDAEVKVADWYEGVLTSQGYDVDRFAANEEVWVTASDAHDPWLRTVLITRQAEQTMIVASARPLAGATGSPGVPVPDGCRALNTHGARDQSVRTEVVFLHCGTSVGEAVDAYDDVLYGADRRMNVHDHASAHVAYSGRDLEVSLAARQVSQDPPVTFAAVTWQERR